MDTKPRQAETVRLENGEPEFTSLEDRLADEGPFSPAEVLRLLRPVAEELRAAHAEGKTHRDLKARRVGAETGKPTLLEEDLIPEGDPAQDVWELARLAYQLVEDRQPFSGSPAARETQIRAGTPDEAELEDESAEVREAWNAVLRWGLAPEGSRRPAGPVALLEALEEAGSGRIPAGALPFSKAVVPAGNGRGLLLPALGAAGLLIAAGLGLSPGEAVGPTATPGIRPPGGAAGGLAFLAGGAQLAAGGDEGVHVYSLAKPASPLRTHRESSRVRALAASPDGALLAWTTEGKRGGAPPFLRVYRGEAEALSLADDGFRVGTDLAFSPDGARLAQVGLQADRVRVWELGSGAETPHLILTPGVSLVDADFAPDGKSFVVAARNAPLHRWSADHRSPVGRPLMKVWMKQEGSFQKIAHSPDGKAIAGAYEEGTLVVLDVWSRRELAVMEGAHQGKVTALAYSPDGKHLASGGADGKLRLWDPSSGEAVATLLEVRSKLARLAFSPDGKTLAAAFRDGSIHLAKIP